MATSTQKWSGFAAQPAMQTNDCTATDIVTKTLKIGDTVIADSKEYIVEKTVTKANQVCATDTDAAKAVGTRIYAPIPVPVSADDLSAADAAARAGSATQVYCQWAGKSYPWFQGELACALAAFNLDVTKALECTLPAFCSSFHPNYSVVTSGPTTTKWTLALGTHNPTINGITVWAKSTKAISNKNPINVRPRATKFRKGKNIKKGAVVFSGNQKWQCLLGAGACGKVKPGTSATTWGKPVDTAAELEHQKTNSLAAADKLDYVDPKDESYAEEWTSGAQTKSSAYNEGSEAIGEDGKVWRCAQVEISGVAIAESDILTTAEISTQAWKKGATLTDPKVKDGALYKGQYKYNANCVNYPPGSKNAKPYWKASDTVIDEFSQPPGLDAQAWEASGGYQKFEKVVQGGAIYSCKDANWCDEDPTKTLGAKGWRKTPYVTKGTSYDKTGTKKRAYRWIQHITASKFPYKKGDRVLGIGTSSAKYFLCIAAGAACRKNTATNYPVATANVWTEQLTTEKAKHVAAGEIKTTDRAYPKALTRRDRNCLTFNTAADEKEGAVRADSAANGLAAWLCTTATCAKGAAPIAANGWRLQREQCTVVSTSDADQLAAAQEGWTYERGTAYLPNEYVVVDGGAKGKAGGTAYQCVKAYAEFCAEVDPREGSKKVRKSGGAGNDLRVVWLPSKKMAKSKGPAVSLEVEAIPLEQLVQNSNIKLRKGQSFQFEGRVYECDDAAKCGLISGVKTLMDQNDKKVKKGRTIKTFTGGKCIGRVGVANGADGAEAKKCKAKTASTNQLQDPKTCVAASITSKKTDCQLTAVKALTYEDPALVSVPRKIATELLANGKGWKQTHNRPKKGKGAWAKINAKDTGSLKAAGVGIVCDAVKAAAANPSTGWYWLKGGVFCDVVKGKAWTCLDPLKCMASDTSPTSNAGTDAAFLKVWTPVAATATSGKYFLMRPDLQKAQNVASSHADKKGYWSWLLVNGSSKSYVGNYKFATGELAFDVARLWKCVGSAAKCAATQPSLDTAGAVWKLTTLKGVAKTTADMLLASPVDQQCFKWAAGYPVQAGDVVCDPEAPQSRSWTVRDPVCASAVRPSLKGEKANRECWGLTTSTSRVAPDGKTTAALIVFKSVDAPKEGAAVQCSDWSTLARGADVAAALTWCDKGRVWKCVETADAASKRPCCSGTAPSAKGARCWQLTRQRGTVAVVARSVADAGLTPDVPATSGCRSGNQFGVGHATWKDTSITSGALMTKAGRICVVSPTKDAGKQWMARLRSASVTPRGKIADDYTGVKSTWAKAPFNVQVADAALDGAALEEVLMGAGYRDAAHRRVLLNVIGWFPGLCGDRAAADLRTWKQVCRADIAAAVTFALMGEGDAGAYTEEKRAQKLVTSAQWWQTAFRTIADSDCYVAEYQTARDAKKIVYCNTAAKDLKTDAVPDVKGDVAFLAGGKKHYYSRGAGPMPLHGAADYSMFSRAMTGTESTFGLTPEALLNYGVKVGVWRGRAHGVMPMAVALWRYVTPQGDAYPSVHEVASGMWAPSTAEKAVKLAPMDFCTVAALVSAGVALHTGGLDSYRKLLGQTQAKEGTADAVALQKPWQMDGIYDGTLGAAWRAIHTRLGAKVPAPVLASGATATPYDYTCKHFATTMKKVVGWPLNAAAQKTWLTLNRTSQKCDFAALPGLSRLTVWTDGDVARCEMASLKDATNVAYTVEKRRLAHTKDRQECLLWSLTNSFGWASCANGTGLAVATEAQAKASATAFSAGPKQPKINCVACVPRAGCDAACKAAAPLTTGHDLWVCVDHTKCHNTEPKSGVSALIWAPWAFFLKATVPSPDVQGNLYAVRELPVLTSGAQTLTVPMPVGTVPCIPYKRLFAEKLNLRMLDSLAPGAPGVGGFNANPDNAAVDFVRSFVCAAKDDLRAYACAAATGAAANLMTTKCATDNAVATSGPHAGVAAKKALWSVVTGAMGVITPTFAERFPDCLVPRTAVTAANTRFQAQESFDQFETLVLDRSSGTNAALWDQSYPGRLSDFYLQSGAKTLHATNDSHKLWKYRVAPPTGIAVDKTGNLCTNLQGRLKVANPSDGTAPASVPKPTAMARAFMGSVADAWFDKAAGLLVTQADDAAKKTALTDGAKENVGLKTAQVYLTSAIFTTLTTAGTNTKLKYWDFLAALAAAPALCNTVGSGRLSGMSAAAVCARDLAGLWAAMIASTSAADKTKATPDKTTGKAPTPYAAQGFFTTGDHCKPLGAAVESAKDKRLYTLCNEKVLAAPAWLLYGSGTDGWCKPDTSCSKAGKYPPAGPLKLGGVLDTWWFSVHAEGVALAKTPSIAFVPASLPVTNGAIVAGAKAYQYWLSAVFKWMVPIAGRPAPHNIMTGLWEPSPAEAAAGVPEGFGAVTKLLAPAACGKGASGQEAQIWRDSWTAMATTFSLSSVTVGAKKEVATSGGDKADCKGANQEQFPAGLWASVPAYLHASYKVAGGSIVRGANTGKCWGSHTVSASLVYGRGAYAICADANKPANQAATKVANKIDADRLKAAAAAVKTDGDLMAVDLKCRADAAALSVKGTALTPAGNRILSARVCKVNKACEEAAVAVFAELARCPVNAACLRAAKGVPKTRALCYLLKHAKAGVEDKKH